MAKIQFNHFWWNIGRKKIVGNVLQKISSKNSNEVLDIGTGYGAMLNLLEKSGNVEAIEMFPPALSFLKNNFKNKIYEYEFPKQFPQKSFHLITMLDVLSAIEDEMKAVQTVHRLLLPGGFFLVTVPAFQFLYSSHDIKWGGRKRYSLPEMVSRLKNSEFKIIDKGYFNSLLFPLAVLERIWKKKKADEKIFASQPVDFYFSFGKILNSIFKLIFLSEAKLIQLGIRFPFGLSFFILAQKK